MRKWICPNCEEALFTIYRKDGVVYYKCKYCGEVLEQPNIKMEAKKDES